MMHDPLPSYVVDRLFPNVSAVHVLAVEAAFFTAAASTLLLSLSYFGHLY